MRVRSCHQVANAGGQYNGLLTQTVLETVLTSGAPVFQPASVVTSCGSGLVVQVVLILLSNTGRFQIGFNKKPRASYNDSDCPCCTDGQAEDAPCLRV